MYFCLIAIIRKNHLFTYLTNTYLTKLQGARFLTKKHFFLKFIQRNIKSIHYHCRMLKYAQCIICCALWVAAIRCFQPLYSLVRKIFDAPYPIGCISLYKSVCSCKKVDSVYLPLPRYTIQRVVYTVYEGGVGGIIRYPSESRNI